MFNNKTAIVTGAGSGIGRAIAHAMAKRSANVVLIDINLESIEKVYNEIRTLGNGKFITIKMDVSNSKEVEKGINYILAEFGKIDILVNNAAIGGPNALFYEVREEDWDEVIKINLKSIFIFCKAVIKHMMERKYGKIINISSFAGKEGNPYLVPYSVAKAGVINLTRVIALTVAPLGINVNSVCAGTALTPMLSGLPENQIKDLIKKIPMGRLARPEETAAVVCFLASDDASFITGQCINVTGGRGYE